MYTIFENGMIQKVIAEVEAKMTSVLGKEVQVISYGDIGGGCINNASKIRTTEGEFFLKWNANCARDMFLREAESLKELKKAADNNLLVPNVVCEKEVDEIPGFLVMDYFETGASSGDCDVQLGRGLALLHGYTNEKFGFYTNNYCGATIQNNTWTESWVDFFRDKRLGFLLALIDRDRPIGISERKLFDKLLNKIDSLIPAKREAVLIHGDLWSGNYMFTKHGPALIDPAAYYADREMEFAIITMFGGFSTRFFDAYNETCPLDKEWRERNKLYQLYHILNHYYLFGGSYIAQAVGVARSYL